MKRAFSGGALVLTNMDGEELPSPSTFHSMFKHVDMNYHGICDALDVKLLELAKIHTNDNVLI